MLAGDIRARTTRPGGFSPMPPSVVASPPVPCLVSLMSIEPSTCRSRVYEGRTTPNPHREHHPAFLHQSSPDVIVSYYSFSSIAPPRIDSALPAFISTRALDMAGLRTVDDRVRAGTFGR
nr:hypothetical protein CFP56_56947 [Quercus suber]